MQLSKAVSCMFQLEKTMRKYVSLLPSSCLRTLYCTGGMRAFPSHLIHVKDTQK